MNTHKRIGGRFQEYLLLAIAVSLLYFQVYPFEFVGIDDAQYVTENARVTAPLSLDNMGWAFRTVSMSNWHPLTWLSHILAYQVFGANACGHHLVNVGLHAANALLLFAVMRRMTESVRQSPGSESQSGDWRSRGQSLFVAALFAVHPLHVESVAWVAGRKDVLSAFFAFLALLGYTGYVRTPSVMRYAVLVVLPFVLSLMAKPMMVTLPFLLLLLDYWPLERVRRCEGVKGEKGKAVQTYRWIFLEKVPLFAISAASSIVTFLAQQEGGSVMPFKTFPLGPRVSNALVAYIGYIFKAVAPVRLAVFYPHPEGALPLWQPIAAAAALVAITVLALLWLRRRPYLAVGWFWYLGTLAPVIGIIQVGPQAMADRYSYIPLVGLSIMVAWGIPDLVKAGFGGLGGRDGRDGIRFFSFHTALAVAGFIVIVLLGVAACLQVRHWRNSETLFGHALEVTKDNAVAQEGYGQALAGKGQWDQAMAHYREALRIQPDFGLAHCNLGVALAGQGARQEAAAEYAEAIRLDIVPHQTKARICLGNLLSDQGRWAEAIEQYRAFLEQTPGDALAHNNLGRALAQVGRLDEAAEHFAKVTVLDPTNLKAYNNLGNVLMKTERYDEAIVQFKKALDLDPAYAVAHNNIGTTLAKLGRFGEAAEHFTKATVLDPTYLKAYYNLGDVLMETGRYDEAIAQFKKVLDLDPADKQARERMDKAMALRDSHNK